MAADRFHGRVFASLCTAFSFAVMSVSGFILYFVPQGRIAYWTDWKLAGLSKTDWTNIHLLSSYLFFVVGLYHLLKNWRAFSGYIYRKVKSAAPRKKELVTALMITAVITVGGVVKFPPLSYVVDFGDYLKASWVTSKDLEPPFGHAEQLSLRAFTKRMNTDMAAAIEALRSRGMVVADDGEESLQAIAKKNKTSPMAVFQVIRHPVPPKEASSGGQSANDPKRSPAPAGKAAAGGAPVAAPRKAGPALYTEDLIVSVFEGKGIGRKNLDDVCMETGVDPAKAKAKLHAKGMEVRQTETLKEAAGRLNVNPIDILKVILIGEPVRPS